MKIDWRIFTETIAAISIVLSLIFVGLEIRQSSSIARMEAYQAYSLSIAENVREIFSNPEFATLVNQANREGKVFSGVERTQMGSFYISILHLYHGLYQSVREEIVSEDLLLVIDNEPSLATPAFRDLWPDINMYWGSDFVRYIESNVLEE